MNIIKGFLSLIAIIVILAVLLAATIGPAVAYFVWGWKVALGWFFISTGLGALIQIGKALTTTDE